MQQTIYLDDPQEVLKKVLEERKQNERKIHTERVATLMRERMELEIRLVVVNDLLKHIEEWAFASIVTAK